MKRFVACLLVLLLFVGSASAETLREQVNAPETYDATYYSNTGKTEIIVNAVVYIPATDHVNTYEVAGRDATAHDAMLMATACAPETNWETDWLSDEPDVSIANGYHFSDYAYTWYPPSDGDAEYNASGYVLATNFAKETVFGLRRETTQIEYSYDYGTVQMPSFYAASTYMDDMGNTPRAAGDRLSGQPITYGEAQELADAFIQRVSPDFGFALYGSSYGERTSRRAYAFRFMRVVDGIPVTYAYWGWPGEDIDEQHYSSPPKMEEITCVIDQGRIVSAYWLNPWEIGGVLQENVQLMPFQQIMDVFGAICPLTVQSMENEHKAVGGEGNRWEITEIRFGYMPVLRKDNSSLWELRPVWDFIGIRSFANEYYDWPGNCALTIDAIDGTVIDRSYGY